MDREAAIAMTIRILLFAILRDAAGAAELSLDVPEGSTVAFAAGRLLDQFPSLRPYLPRVAYAVNRSYASSEAPLHDGDEVALIPPVSGG
jgi:molybdopterin converting factor subunit 1